MSEFHSTNPLVTGIDAAVIATQRQINAALAQMPHPDPRTADGLQMLRTLTANNEAGTVLTPIDRYIEIPSGRVRLHILVPNGPIRGVMLDIHGGGWAAGAPEDDDTFNDQLARALTMVVVAPDYRLTPAVTIAEQIDDSVAVAEWLGANAYHEYGTDVIIIGGISAGAHLAAATLLRLRDSRSPTFRKIAAARLDSGPYDLGFTPSAYLSSEDSLVLTHDWLFGLVEVGLPGLSLEQRRTPALSPMLNDLSGLPPALFTVGDLDPLRDDSILMAARWQLAGGTAALDVWPEGGHAFINMATPLGDLALNRAVAWLNTIIEAAESATAPA
jgi:acetyl esterase